MPAEVSHALPEAAALIIDFANAVSYGDRIRAVAETRKASDEKVASALAALEEAGQPYEALLAVKVAGVRRPTPFAGTLLRLLGNASPHVVKAAARAVVQAVPEDAAVVARFSELVPAAQKLLVRAVVSRRGPDGRRRAALATSLLPLVREGLGPEACALLHKVAPIAEPSKLETAVAMRIKWRALAPEQPALVARHVREVAQAAKPWAKKAALKRRGLTADVLPGLSRARDKEPLLELLRSGLAEDLACEMHFRCNTDPRNTPLIVALRGGHISLLEPLLLQRFAPVGGGYDFNNMRGASCVDCRSTGFRQMQNLLAKLPGDLVERLAEAALRARSEGDAHCGDDDTGNVDDNFESNLTNFCCLLMSRPSKERGALVQKFREQGLLKVTSQILRLLQREDRVAEARIWRESAKCGGRLLATSWLPADEVLDELSAACRGIKDESVRALRAGLLVKCSCRSGEVVRALQWMAQRMRTEVGQVRGAAVRELANQLTPAYTTDDFRALDAPGVNQLTDACVPLLQQVLSHRAKEGYDYDERESWCAIAAEAIRHAVRHSMHLSSIVLWALKVLPELGEDYVTGDDWYKVANLRLGYGRVGILNEGGCCDLLMFWLGRAGHTATPGGSMTLPFECRMEVTDSHANFPSKAGPAARDSDEFIGDAAFRWLWKEVAVPMLDALKAAAQKTDSGGVESYCTTLVRLACWLARRPRRRLFTEPLLAPLLQEVLDLMEPLPKDGFAVVEGAKIEGEDGGEMLAPLAFKAYHRERALDLLISNPETREKAIAFMRVHSDLLPGMARGRSALIEYDMRRFGGPIVARLAARSPELVLPFLEKLGPDSEPGITEREKNEWAGGIRYPPCYRAHSFVRWTPEQQQRYLEVWLAPLVRAANPFPLRGRTGSHPHRRPPSGAECSMRLAARLTFAAPLLPALLSEALELHSRHAIVLARRQREVADAAAAGTEPPVAASDEDLGGWAKESSLTVKLGNATFMAAGATVAMAQSQQAPAEALAKLREASSTLPGEGGKIAVKSLRRAGAWSMAGCGKDAAALLACQDLGVGVRKGLFVSLLAAGRQDLLAEQWRDDMHHDVRCICVELAAEALPPVLEVLERAAASLLASESQPFETVGVHVAKALMSAKVAEAFINPSLEGGARRKDSALAVFGAIVRLPASSVRKELRLEALQLMHDLAAAATEGGGGMMEMAGALASLAAVVARDESAEDEEHSKAVKVMLAAAYVDSAPLVTFLREASKLVDWARDARLLRVSLLYTRQLLPAQRSSLASLLQALPAPADELKADERPEVLLVVWGFQFLALPWGSVEALPPRLLVLCESVPDASMVGQFMWVLEETLECLPKTTVTKAVLDAAAAALLARGGAVPEAAACKVTTAEAKQSPRGWAGCAKAHLERLRASGDRGVRMEAHWMALKADSV